MYKLKIGDKIDTTLLSQIYFEICLNIHLNAIDFLKKESSEKKLSPESLKALIESLQACGYNDQILDTSVYPAEAIKTFKK
jgi:hypothetical protein